jgi:Bacterial PH domain
MQTFQIAAANGRALWLLVPLAAIPLVIVSVIMLMVISGMRARFEVSSAGLRLTGDFYGRTVAVSDLRGGSARRVDMSTENDLQPVRRTMGTGLPGYRAGWFRLRNGEKALLYVTDPTKAVYVPTRLDYSVIVSPSDPDGFLSAVRAVAPSP